MALKWYYSVTRAYATAGWTASGSKFTCYGPYISKTQITGGLENLFDRVTFSEASAATVEYRGIFLYNTATSGTPLSNVGIYIYDQTESGTDIAIGLDPVGAGLHFDTATEQCAIIANYFTAPEGVSFSTPTTISTALSVAAAFGNSHVQGVWIRRTCLGPGAVSLDDVTLRVVSGL